LLSAISGFAFVGRNESATMQAARDRFDPAK
jgi:hypothetical protein